VYDAQGNPLDGVTIKLEAAPPIGVRFAVSGDQTKMLQPGQWKLEFDGYMIGEYKLTVVRGQGDPTPLSQTYADFKMRACQKAGQQSNIIFQRNY
jgi:hypothetical protein